MLLESVLSNIISLLFGIELLENADVTDEEIAIAKEVLEKAKKKNKDIELKDYTISNTENYKNYLS